MRFLSEGGATATDWNAHADGIVSISKLKEGDTDTNTLIMRFDRGADCVWNCRPYAPRFGSDQGGYAPGPQR